MYANRLVKWKSINFESWLRKYKNTIEKEMAMEKYHLIQFLTMLFFFSKCAHEAAGVNATVSFF